MMILLTLVFTLLPGSLHGGTPGRGGLYHRPPQDTATVQLFLRYDPWSDPIAGGCKGQFLWLFTPVHLTGSAGQQTSFTIDHAYTVEEQCVSPRECYCLFPALATAVRPGSWLVWMQHLPWHTECEVELQSGTNAIHFRYPSVGCMQGFGAPGD
jgi:hypothetical protein